jgi:predicted AAA+ superfamily ATPase
MYRRKLFDKLVAHLAKREFSIISGARQTGKSTLLRQVEEYCKTADFPTAFLNLENKSVLAELNKHPMNLFGFLPTSSQRIYVFIDEIQYLDDPSNFLKLLFDEHVNRLKLVVTGSSAFYLDEKFNDSLAGRKRIFNLLTCDFDEYLELNSKPQFVEEVNRLINQPEAKSSQLEYLRIEWENYMIYGGYPAVVAEPDKNEKIVLLKEIRDSFIKRDILESGVSNETAFYQLFRILAEQSGKLVNLNELSTVLRIKNETVGNYISVMQKCFHIVLSRPFYRNLRKELIKMPKIYFLDIGLRNCLLNNFQPLSTRIDKGELWENQVFRILADKYGMESVYFWRTSAGNEIDFVLPDIEKPKAIEVKFDEAQVKPNKYNLFTDAYPEIPLKFIWFQPFGNEFFRSLAEL